MAFVQLSVAHAQFLAYLKVLKEPNYAYILC